MRFLHFSAAICVTLCLSGCFSLDHAVSSTSGGEHVLVTNYGWKLFNCIPLCCGNAAENGFSPCVFFRNDVTIDKMQSRFFSYAKKRGKDATDLTYHNYDTVIFEIPLTGIVLPIPYVLCYSEIQLSGTLK